jgi:hypothetical protein
MRLHSASRGTACNTQQSQACTWQGSVGVLISCRTSGRRVRMSEPRGRNSRPTCKQGCSMQHTASLVGGVKAHEVS